MNTRRGWKFDRHVTTGIYRAPTVAQVLPPAQTVAARYRYSIGMGIGVGTGIGICIGIGIGMAADKTDRGGRAVRDCRVKSSGAGACYSCTRISIRIR